MKITPKLLKSSLLTLALSTALVLPFFSGTANALFGGAKDEACSAVGASDAAGHCDTGENGALANSQNQLHNTIEDIINLLTIVIGVMSVIMIIISGIRFITSNGDSNKITSARNTLIYAIVGLVVVAFAQIIVKLVLSKIL